MLPIHQLSIMIYPEIHTPHREETTANQSVQDIYEKECNSIIDKCRFIITDVMAYLKGELVLCWLMSLLVINSQQLIDFKIYFPANLFCFFILLSLYILKEGHDLQLKRWSFAGRIHIKK